MICMTESNQVVSPFGVNASWLSLSYQRAQLYSERVFVDERGAEGTNGATDTTRCRSRFAIDEK
jgi:hypothetical protein